MKDPVSVKVQEQKSTTKVTPEGEMLRDGISREEWRALQIGDRVQFRAHPVFKDYSIWEKQLLTDGLALINWDCGFSKNFNGIILSSDFSAAVVRVVKKQK